MVNIVLNVNLGLFIYQYPNVNLLLTWNITILSKDVVFEIIVCVCIIVV